MFPTKNKNDSLFYEGNNTNHSLLCSYKEQELVIHVPFSPRLMWFGKQEANEFGSPLLLGSVPALEVPCRSQDKTSTSSSCFTALKRVTSTFSIILFLFCLYLHRMRLKAQLLNLCDFRLMEMRTQLSEYLKIKTQTFIISFENVFKSENTQINTC